MIPPLTKWINDIKVKLGFSRTMTAAGADVVDAVNKHSDQIAALGPYNGLDSDSTTAALSAAKGKYINDSLKSKISYKEGSSLAEIGITGYYATAIQEIIDTIASKNSGIYTIRTGGPFYTFILGKALDNYFSLIDISYYGNAIIQYKYLNGRHGIFKIESFN